MLSKRDILNGLSIISNDYINIAILWHIMILIFIAALFLGWKPGNSLMILLSSSLLMSVSAFAAIEGNIFNAAVFAFLVIMSIYASLSAESGQIKGNRSWPDIIGLLLIAYGLIYPEFLRTGSLLEYAYTAPTGLIPCPTLAVLTGFTLLYKGFGSLKWTITIIITGLFYGLFGVFYLGINIDWVLVIGAVILLFNTWFIRKPFLMKGI